MKTIDLKESFVPELHFAYSDSKQQTENTIAYTNLAEILSREQHKT